MFCMVHANVCFVVLYMEMQHVDPSFYDYFTYVNPFSSSPPCKLIGYKSGVQLENAWFSLNSKLPYTVDMITYGNVPQFNYAGAHYNTDNLGNFFRKWTEKSVQGTDTVYRWPISCWGMGGRHCGGRDGFWIDLCLEFIGIT